MHHLITRTAAVLALAAFAVGCGSSSVTSSVRSSIDSITTAPVEPSTTPATVPTTEPTDTKDPMSPTTPDPAPQEILDRFWRADSNITVGGLRPLPTGTGAGFTITADGTITVNTGCNSGSGHVTFENGSQMVVGPLALTRMACPESAGNVEAAMIFILGERNTYSVDGDSLKLIPLGITDVGLTLVADG